MRSSVLTFRPASVPRSGEVFRVLKPGGYFISYEWCLTDLHDKRDARHLWAKKKIEEAEADRIADQAVADSQKNAEALVFDFSFN